MRFFAVIVALCTLLSACGDKNGEQILFFTHDGCPYCEKALQYINTNYDNLPMQILEVSKAQNMKRFIACADKFKLDKRKLGTPLICMKDGYILGWSEMDAAKFRKLVKTYVK